MSIGFNILFLSLVAALAAQKRAFGLMWVLGSVLICYEYSQALFIGNGLAYQFSLPLPLGAIEIGLSKTAAYFGIVVSVGLALGITFGMEYLKLQALPGQRAHLFWLGILGLSMHAMLWVQHTLAFLMIWEVMSMASVFLCFGEGNKALRDGIFYLVMVHVGAVFLIAGFALSYVQSGSFGFASLKHLSNPSLILLLIGFAFKAGFFPLYSWLPKTYSIAPAHVSGIMSGVKINTGLYGIILLFQASLPSLTLIIICAIVSLITILLGVFNSMSETSLKRALAYSSVENVGIIGLGLCIWLWGRYSGSVTISVLGFAGAMLHLLFHSIFKALLFYQSGIIYCVTQTMETERLGGLHKNMPKTAILFLTGVGGISALPLFSGFVSEFVIYYALINGIGNSHIGIVLFSIIGMAVMAFAGAMALIGFLKLFSIMFLGEPRSDEAARAIEPKGRLHFPLVILALMTIAGGIFGSYVLDLVRPLMAGMAVPAFKSLQNILQNLSIAFVLILLISLLLYFIRKRCVQVDKSPTWGCGYHHPSPRMQYTSKAFVQPLSYFLLPFVMMRKKLIKPQNAFPTHLEYEERVLEPIYELLLIPFSKFIRRFLKLFAGIHNGKTNSYIAWNLGFLILLLILVLGVLK